MDAAEGTLVCRCEAVTAKRVMQAGLEFGGDADAVKGYTRAGMGRCQGRNCSASIGELSKSSQPHSPAFGFRARLPVRPVLVGDLVCNVPFAEPQNLQLGLSDAQTAAHW